MNEELKKYVNAYMDDEKVDYQFTDYAINDDWYRVGMFSDFDRKGVTFRITPKEEDKWQRIKDIDPVKYAEDKYEFLNDILNDIVNKKFATDHSLSDLAETWAKHSKEVLSPIIVMMMHNVQAEKNMYIERKRRIELENEND